MEFVDFFAQLAGDHRSPHPWQQDLAMEPELRSRLIRIPTGMGKTLGVLGAWSWHRLHLGDSSWPRRLVWCLPMRVLVEQTEEVVREATERLSVLWDGGSDHAGRVGVHVLMGGNHPGGEWTLYPEECAVLIGTQDMLLSRALNRGYAAGRARWPLEFGLLSHDALWVIDEAQLMDVGLATSAQLQAYHEADASQGLRPRLTWWMSATLQPAWLKSVDTEARYADWVRKPAEIPGNQRRIGLGAITKSVSHRAIAADAHEDFGQLVLGEHGKLDHGEHGRITLVVCNTVDRACRTYDAIRERAPDQDVDLVHSRYRAAERAAWRNRVLSRQACRSGADRIVVATQVVEAGVDISAGVLVTDLAPWPSLVQRFGRCARYGGAGVVHVVDRGRDDRTVAPYSAQELDAAWDAIQSLAISHGDVGTASLEDFEAGLDDTKRQRLFPYQPRHLLLRQELDELFDTTPDLTGADIDISRFIRSGDERDLLVFWLDLPRSRKGEPPPVPPADRKAARDELCAIPFLKARDWLCGEETKNNRKSRLKPSARAWVWDWIDGAWVIADRAALVPGRVVCVAADVGGYRRDRGFDPESKDHVPPVPAPALAADDEAGLQSDDRDGSDALSVAAWKTIACHAREAVEQAERIAAAVHLPGNLRKILALAARWHDVGKTHPAFQGSIRPKDEARPDRQDLAKAPRLAWLRPPGAYRTADDKDSRPGFRHELASALALFAVLQRRQPMHPALLGPWTEALSLTGLAAAGEPIATGEPTTWERAVLDCSAEDFDLLAYLVACHHGKVRVALHAGPRDQDYRDSDGRGLPIRGIREGDKLPAFDLDGTTAPVPPSTLTLDPATLGLSPRTGRSWRERTLGLMARFGPGSLAWLEALIMAADRRASRLNTSDPLLAVTTGAPR